MRSSLNRGGLTAAARRARDELHQEAREELNQEVRAHQGNVQDHQAAVHRDQLASGGASRTLSKYYKTLTLEFK
jgi:hypothetical protein